MEVKPPKERCPNKYAGDLWKLANFCKDGINHHLNQGIDIRMAAGIQVFGKPRHANDKVFCCIILLTCFWYVAIAHCMSMDTLEYTRGMYIWAKCCTALIPCDQTDTARVQSCLRLAESLEVTDLSLKAGRMILIATRTLTSVHCYIMKSHRNS